MKIFSGSSNKPLAEKIAKEFERSLSPLEIFIFPDGEKRVQVQVPVVDEDVVIIQSTATPAAENYMELFFIADALRRNGAREITVVMPYMGYQRQDHVFRTGEAVSLQVVISMLEALKINRVIACDLHSIKIPEFFTIPLTHLSALPLFAETIKKEGWVTLDTVLVSPDMGGIRRIKLMSEMLSDMPFVTIVKDRDLATGNIASSGLQGEVTRRAIIVDDMSSSGKTLVQANNMLREKGAEEVFVFVTHSVFSQDAPKLLQDSSIDKVYVTDSVDVPQDKKFEKLHILSLAPSIFEAIQR